MYKPYYTISITFTLPFAHHLNYHFATNFHDFFAAFVILFITKCYKTIQFGGYSLYFFILFICYIYVSHSKGIIAHRRLIIYRIYLTSMTTCG